MTDDAEVWQHITGLPVKRVEHFEGGVNLFTTEGDDPPVWPEWSFVVGGAQLAINDEKRAASGEGGGA